MKVRDLTLTALFIALGILLPFITGQLQSIGSMLLPMHLPVMIGGLILPLGNAAICDTNLKIFTVYNATIIPKSHCHGI